MAHLDILYPDGTARRIVLDREAYTIGRDENADIRLSRPQISRCHARIYHQGGRHWVEDLGSVSGIALDGAPIGSPKQLMPGCRIHIGDVLLTYGIEQSSHGLIYALQGLTPPCEGQSFALLPHGELGVGRGTTNAIHIPHISLSRTHAKLQVGPEAITVIDLDSGNGTFVNGKRIQEQRVDPGDVITFGAVELRLAAHRPGRDAAQRPRQQLGGSLAIGLMGAITVVLATVWVQPDLPKNLVPWLSGGNSVAQVYQRSVEAGLARAQALLHQEKWQEAARAYEHVLDRDPLSAAARAGWDAARTRQHHEQLVQKAEGALTDQHAESALHMLSHISTTSYYGAPAARLAAHARSLLAEQTLTSAQTACALGRWQACLTAANRHLALDPTSTSAQALFHEAYHGTTHTSRLPSALLTDTGSRRWPRAATLFVGRYGDPDVRQVALRYASGDPDAALKRARTLTQRTGGASLLDNLVEFRRARTNSDGAVLAGDTDKAIAAWERALEADAKIIPPLFPSIPREQLQQQLVDALYNEGEKAFNRGRYRQAFAVWERGLRRMPDAQPLLAAVARLEKRAQGLLHNLEALPERDAHVCEQLQDLLAMTHPTSATHKRAAELLAQCGR